MNAITSFLSGKKTYTVSILLVVSSLLPAVQALAAGAKLGEALGLVDIGKLLDGLGLSSLRAAIAKS